MNIAFVLDTGLSMGQRTRTKLSLLDIGKIIVESFCKLRAKHSLSKFDKLYLLTTSADEKARVLSQYYHDISHFNFQLRTITAEGSKNVPAAIVHAYNLMNKQRMFYGYDNYMGGRDPMKTDNGIVIFITSGADISYVRKLEEKLSGPTFYRWDQQFYTFLVHPFDNLVTVKIKKGEQFELKHPNFDRISSFCKKLAGECIPFLSQYGLEHAVDRFLISLRPNFTLNLAHANYTPSADEGLDFYTPSSLPDLPFSKKLGQVKLLSKNTSTYLNSKSQISVGTMLSKVPLPEAPFPFKIKNPAYFERDLRKSNMAVEYYGFPTYYIDFSRAIHAKLNSELVPEKFEVDVACEFLSGTQRSYAQAPTKHQ